MSINVSATFGEEQVKREGIGVIDAYILNASRTGTEYLYFANWNQNIKGFKLNATGDFLATTETYTGLPIKREEIKTNLQGEAPALSISVPNTDRNIESYIQNRSYLRGHDIYCITAFIKHLPSGSSAQHIGTDPDRFAIIKEKLYIDTVSTSDETAVSFSCKPKISIKNKVLPGRTYSRECEWASRGRYAGIECSPQNQINATMLNGSYPTCDGSLEQCEERRNKVRYGGFVSIPNKGIVIV